MDKWHITVAASESPAVIENVLRDATAYIAESFGDDVSFDIEALDPEGEPFSGYVNERG